MNAIELVERIEGSGGRFQVDGEKVAVTPRSAAEPLAEELRIHKQEILELLTLRSDLPPGVRIVSWQLKPPPIPMPPCSMVTNTRKFVFTTLRQLEHHLAGKGWLDGNYSLPVLLGRLKRVGVEVQIDAPAKDSEVTYAA
jgi:hypothetical protein